MEGGPIPILSAARFQPNVNPDGPIPTAPSGPLNCAWYQAYGSVQRNWTGSIPADLILSIRYAF